MGKADHATVTGPRGRSPAPAKARGPDHLALERVLRNGGGPDSRSLGTDGVIDLQRTAGNKATSAALSPPAATPVPVQRTVGWDTPAHSVVSKGDGEFVVIGTKTTRTMGRVLKLGRKGSNETWLVTERALGNYELVCGPEDIAAIKNPKAYFTEHDANWDAIREKAKAGRLTFEKGDDENGQLKPGSKHGMNALLAFRLRETLLKKSDDAGSQSVMEKAAAQVAVVQQAQWHKRQQMMKSAGLEGEPPPIRPLSWNYGAGSGTATSDIDSNLQGDATETAVAIFNKLFRQKFQKESGEAFDVNVYATDYLPSGKLGDAGKAARLSAAGGAARKALAPGSTEWGGGVSFETTFREGGAAAAEVTESQELYSLLKLRKEMPKFDWLRYRVDQLAALKGNAEAASRKSATFDKVDEMFHERQRAVALEMQQMGQAASALASAGPKAARGRGRQDRLDPSTDSARVGAENVLYEKALSKVQDLRDELFLTQAKYRAKQASLDDVEAAGAKLRVALHQSSMYANEAYITNAAVLHVVGNLQVLKSEEAGSGLEIGLSVDDYLASINEQVGFIFDDIRKERDNLPKAFLKAGKYLYRLGQAAGQVEKAVVSAGKGKAMEDHPTSAEMQAYGNRLMEFKNLPPLEQIASVRGAMAGGDWQLGRSVSKAEATILHFESRIQALAASR